MWTVRAVVAGLTLCALRVIAQPACAPIPEALAQVPELSTTSRAIAQVQADDWSLAPRINVALVSTIPFGEQSVTILAPRNEAWPAGPLPTTAALVSVLRAHVIPERLTAADLRQQLAAAQPGGLVKKTIGGSMLVFLQGQGSEVQVTHVTSSGSMSELATITLPDAVPGVCSGPVHVIDRILPPVDLTAQPPQQPGGTAVPTPTTVPTTVPGQDCTLAGLFANRTDVDLVLVVASSVPDPQLIKIMTATNEEPFTVFVPSNAAFLTLTSGQQSTIIGDATLVDQLLYLHLVPGKVFLSDMPQGTTVVPALLPNATITITRAGDSFTATSGRVVANVIAQDIGRDCPTVLHVIDDVLLLPELTGAAPLAGAGEAEAVQQETAVAPGVDAGAGAQPSAAGGGRAGSLTAWMVAGTVAAATAVALAR